jgi:hypothetical protein
MLVRIATDPDADADAGVGVVPRESEFARLTGRVRR